MKYEKLAWETGAKLVAGIDEVGRGSLFGPVVAAAVILDPAYRIRGLRDSKLLDREQREKLAPKIRQHSLAWAMRAGPGPIPSAAGRLRGGASGGERAAAYVE